jgi:DNA-binding CsgD family transcriptional regulator
MAVQSSSSVEALVAARDAYSHQDWLAARDGFRAVAERVGLSVEDIVAMADSAWWLGFNDEALASFEQAFALFVSEDRVPSAAKLALAIGFLWMLRGEMPLGSGWVSRGLRLLRELPDCVEQGYGLAVALDEEMAAGRFPEAISIAKDIKTLASRYKDTTLQAVGLVGEGIALTRMGRVKEGLAVLDEAMLSVMAGEVTLDWAGNIYCQLMGICYDLADLRRARHWTDATERWCNRFTSAVMFLGVCRMHRVQLLAVQGDWGGAEEEAWQVCGDLADLNVLAVAESHYQIGEIRRLRGDLVGAEAAYTKAHGLGRDPQPGLALLRLSEGRVATAAASIRSAIASDSADSFTRARLRSAQVEIALAGEDMEGAAEAVEDLNLIASTFSSPGLEAAAGQAAGALLLAQEKYPEALRQLRDAVRRWQELDAPYLAAKARVQVASACRSLDDHDAADLELGAAGAVFDQLGAVIDSKRVAVLRANRALPGSLTVREVEVLSCVAAGQSNREVAAALFIAEKTVARHLSNIFTKLGVSSRTEAAAFAFTHGLVSHRRA